MLESVTIDSEPTTILHLFRPQRTHDTVSIHGVSYRSLPQLQMHATPGTKMHEFGERLKRGGVGVDLQCLIYLFTVVCDFFMQGDGGMRMTRPQSI